jgi:hypothetical protein
MEARQRVFGARENVPEIIDRERWIRGRQRARNERGDRLAPDRAPPTFADRPRQVVPPLGSDPLPAGGDSKVGFPFDPSLHPDLIHPSVHSGTLGYC